jgi:hypothetical protein
MNHRNRFGYIEHSHSAVITEHIRIKGALAYQQTISPRPIGIEQVFVGMWPEVMLFFLQPAN